MPRLPLAIALLIAVLLPRLAPAGEVYKCTDAQGGVAFQDQPCPVGMTQTLLHMADAPPPAAPVATPSTAPSPPPAAAVQPVTAPPPRKLLPPLWVCENSEDGSRYFSRNNNPPVKWVPLGTLGYPGKSLASAYGSGGIGVSAPGMRKIPIDTSPQSALAGDYTQIQDRCMRASREQTCDYLRKQYDQVEHKLNHAFKDQQAVLQPQDDELRDQLDGC